MMVYKLYEKYRAKLTDEEKKLVEAAKKNYDHMCEEAAKENGEYVAYHGGEKDQEGRYIGFEDQNGKFVQNPVVHTHMQIARDRAVEQLKKWPKLPEEVSTFMRYPAVDPLGHSGPIDMAFEQRLAAIRVRMRNSLPGTKQGADILLRMLNNPGKLLQEIKDGAMLCAENQRIYSRASKLCLDEVASQKLYEMSRSMEVAEPVKNLDIYFQGIECILGLRPGPVPDEVKNLVTKKLYINPGWDDLMDQADLRLDRDTVEINFNNLDNRMLQYQFINPNNWNKTPEQVAAENERNGLTQEDGTKIITPYARATAGLELDEIYDPIDARNPYTGFDRGDMIIIDGMSVRERMHEVYIKDLKRPEADFERYYQENLKQASSTLVAAALMAGKRIEAYTLDEKGRIRFSADRRGENIKDRPVSIRKKGYEPSPLNKVTLSTWERFAARFGFYKEKVAKAKEYERAVEAQKQEEERMIDAKVRMKGRWHAALGKNIDACSAADQDMKAQFFANWMRDHDGLAHGDLQSSYSITRTALTTFAICRMMELGYSPEDIYSPDALMNEKLAVGDEVIQRIQENDHDWIARTIFHGSERIADYIDAKCAKFPTLRDNYIFSNENRIIFALAHVMFDADQEKNRVCKAQFVQAAQEKYGQQLGIEKADELQMRMLSTADFFRFAKKYQDVIVETLENGKADHFFSMIDFEARRGIYEEGKQRNPNKPFSTYTDEESKDMQNAGSFSNILLSGLEKTDLMVLKAVVQMQTDSNNEKLIAASKDSARYVTRLFVENEANAQMEIKVGKNFGECFFRALPALREKLIKTAYVDPKAFVTDKEFKAGLESMKADAAEADASRAMRDVIHGRVQPAAAPAVPNPPAPEPPRAAAEPAEPNYPAPEPPEAVPVPPVYDAPKAPEAASAQPKRPAPKAPGAAPVLDEYNAPGVTKTVAPPLQPKRPAPGIRPNGPAPKAPGAAPVPAEYDAPGATKTSALPPQPKRPAPKTPKAPQAGGGGRTR